MKIQEVLLYEDPAAPSPMSIVAQPLNRRPEASPGSEDMTPGPLPGTPVQPHLPPIIKRK
jgi:hypothetical protein